MSAPPPGAGLDPERRGALIAALRGDLEASGWTVAAVDDAIGAPASAALGRDQLVPARRALAGRDDALGVLTSLFVLAEPHAERVVRRRLDAALPRLRSEGAAALGLVRAAGAGRDDAVVPAADLRPWDAGDGEHRWIASDLGEGALGAAVPTDHVLGVGGASSTLAHLTPRTPVGRALDVGTGSGVQALLAAEHADAVVATDTSSRALAFAALNADIAGLDAQGGRGLDLRRGDLLAPVAGETFDLLVSNPPFVITPRRHDVPGWTYRDGGRTGDDVVREMVLGAARVLAPGGTAVMLGDWEHRADESWGDRVDRWVEEAAEARAAAGLGPLDAWVVQREVLDPAHYATTWVRDGGSAPGPATDALVGAWLDDLEGRGVEAVGFGHVVLHAPAGDRRPWRRTEEQTASLEGGLGGASGGGLGDHVAAVIAAQEALSTLDDAALAGLALTTAPDVTEERHHVPGEAGPRVIVLRQGGGYRRAVAASSALAALVGACDGTLTVAQVVAALGELLDAPTGALAAELLPQVRALIADGLLLVP